jgi:hypothetical protein
MGSRSYAAEFGDSFVGEFHTALGSLLENLEFFDDGGVDLGEIGLVSIVDNINEIDLDRLAEGRVNKQVNNSLFV